jgi:hypothetical protein
MLLEYYWNINGMLLEYYWDINGILMEYKWITYIDLGEI